MTLTVDPAELPETPAPEEATGFWQKRLIRPIRIQLTQGASATSLSWAIAAGALFGIFPILGSTTMLCVLAGLLFRLNHPVIQAVNWVVYPLHLLLIPFFIRVGEWVCGAAPISFSIPRMIELFGESPGLFFQKFGMTCWHAIAAWAVIAPLAAVLIVTAVRPFLKAAAGRWNNMKSDPVE
jgi:uncharacterized protein (DUF2062 family)